jgi:hypothetical protein
MATYNNQSDVWVDTIDGSSMTTGIINANSITGMYDATSITSDMRNSVIINTPDGNTIDLVESLNESNMLLGVMTTLLNNLIKENPSITSAQSIEELVDQQKMMNKLAK